MDVERNSSVVPKRRSPIKTVVILSIKLAIAGAVAYLMASRIDLSQFGAWWQKEKRWDLLTLAFSWILIGHLITYMRWWQLVRTFGVPMTLPVAIRVGFLGTAFNLVSVGGIGGDVFKSIAAARLAGRRSVPAVLTSIFLDRVFGLIGLMIVVACALAVGFRNGYFSPESDGYEMIVGMSRFAVIGSAISVFGLFVIAAAGRRLPLHWIPDAKGVGTFVRHAVEAVVSLHGRYGVLGMQLLLSVGVHLSLVLGFYTTTLAVNPGEVPFVMQLIAVPSAFALAALPISFGGLLVFEEAILQTCKMMIGPSLNASLLLVALAVYRVMLTLIAGIGGLYYLGSGRSITVARNLEPRVDAEEFRDAMPSAQVAMESAA